MATQQIKRPHYSMFWVTIQTHPSGCCTLVVVEERPPHPPHMIVKRILYLEKCVTLKLKTTEM